MVLSLRFGLVERLDLFINKPKRRITKKNMEMEPLKESEESTKSKGKIEDNMAQLSDAFLDLKTKPESLAELETILANHPFFMAEEEIDGPEPLPPPPFLHDAFQLLQKYSLDGYTALELAQIHKAEAQSQYNEGKYRIAATIFSEAIKHAELNGEDLELLGNLYDHRGDCQVGIGNYGSGLKDFRTALKVKSDSTKSWRKAVDCCLKLGKPEEGLKILENGLQTGMKDEWEMGARLKRDVEFDRMNSEENPSVPTPSLFAPKNPLLIDLILDVTLSNLPLKDLLSCRLVCETWNRTSLPKVQEKCRELIFSAGDLTPPYRGGRGHRWSNHFLPTMKNSLAIPCSKFQLRLETFNPDLSTFQELIDVCHREITSLHLYPLDYDFGNSATPGPDTNKFTFQNWLKNLKKLKKLTITDFDFGVLSCTSFFEPGYDLNMEKLQEFHFLEVGSDVKPSSHFFDGFFSAAQNLKKMTFGIKDYREEYERVVSPRRDEFYDSSDEEMEVQQYDNDHEEMFQFLDSEEQVARLHLNVALNSLLNHAKLDGLRSITFHLLSNVNLSTLVSIGEKGLTLEEFQVRGAFFEKTKFCEFLETQKKTLKTLIIRGGQEQPETFSLRFPTEMKELRVLDISTNGPLAIREAISYTTGFPKIRKLHVMSGNSRRDYRENVRILETFFNEEKNLVACETLKELRMSFTLSDEEEIDEDEIIERVSGIFPEIVIRVDVDGADDDDAYIGRAREITLNIFGS